ncbi:pyruvate formate lyase-activating protein [Lachnospiraceae bacterium ASD3451]|uniref:pyruvate formate-lyase-activating protein n=1 Tax=Diplocloster agilis TaxID=2850323 RepID=UPI001D26C0B8|nr:pyruvate formate-lyase-activating protein [Diplocloster agilis]MBU9745042.1 pyruvate formate lyase-activating protein [Diplocloster agilis]
MTGKIHSIESFGTVDGPGIRMVIFFQGCPMRCLYCHNPDTWNPNGGREVTVDEILKEYETNKAFYRNGGLTATGGEPLIQIDFLTELFREAHGRGIHTCLDTSGITFRRDSKELMEKFDRLTRYTDLVMLDIKHIDPEAHRALTGQPNDPALNFARYLGERGTPLWIRHVVVPGITDDPQALKRLGAFIGVLPTLKALDVLPYHSMGAAKYDALGLDYPLKGLQDMPKEEAKVLRSYILEGIRSVRNQKE